MDKENLWSRRSNSNKLSVSTTNTENNGTKGDHPIRNYTPRRYVGGDSSYHGKLNARNGVTPLSTPNAAPSTPSASSAFGLGSGAFAAFGSGSKTPKTPGSVFDFGKSSGPLHSASNEKRSAAISKSSDNASIEHTTSPEHASTSQDVHADAEDEQTQGLTTFVPDSDTALTLRYTWILWFRPPSSKSADYEKSIQPMLRFSTAQEFWRCFVHFKRPSSLPAVSDYHMFREGIRPVWEDEENKKGGKFQIRLKKGVADRYWENLQLAMIGDQFSDAGDEVCGAVISVRNGEDVLSVWTKYNGGRNVKILQVLKQVLECPKDTKIDWKSHDDSIAQRIASDQYRQEKASGSHHPSERRRTMNAEDLTFNREKVGVS